MSGRTNVTIRNTQINNFFYGIYLRYSSNNSISGNNITNSDYGVELYSSSNYNSISVNNIANNWYGVWLVSSSNNSIIGNNITANDWYGVLLAWSYNNRFYHNNFINNGVQVFNYENSSHNLWDVGYPSGGNYWSDYKGVDYYSGPYQNETGSDGIGDTPYIIDEYNIDQYRLMAPFKAFEAGVWNQTAFFVDVISNSTLSGFLFNPYVYPPYLKFNVTGADGSFGFCRVTAPKYLLWAKDEDWKVSISGDEVKYTLTKDENNTYLYFTYSHSTKTVIIEGTQTSTVLYNLTITSTTGGTTDPQPGIYAYVSGTSVSITAIPEVGYFFDHWELDGVIAGSTNPINILMTANHTLHAAFLQVYNLIITSTAGGTTDPCPGTYCYTFGTIVNVTALPNRGYSFNYWLLDGEIRTENPITITMNKNYTLEAYFVDDIPPELSEPWQDPPRDNVQSFQNVTVWVNVTDYGTGIKNVTLWYSLDNGTTWNPINMTELAFGTYNATIQGREYCTWITYKIVAYDNAGNNATKDNNGYYYKYHIIPEFPSSAALLGFLMLITIPFVFHKRKCRQKINS